MEIIAEVGLGHDGSLNLAHAYIDAVAQAGADAVKFQCHLPEESSVHEQWRSPWSWYGETRQAYWRRTAFTRDQWAVLADHARDRGLTFGASVFCEAAVGHLAGVVDWWKIPSGMVGHRPLLHAVQRVSRKTYVSNGLSLPYPWWEVVPDAVELRCVSSYPTPLAQCPGPMSAVTAKNGRRMGLSDHSGTIWPALFACAWAEVAEVHVIFDRAMGGPDAESSLTMAELTQLCEGVSAYDVLGSETPACTRNAAIYEPSMVDGVWMKTSGQVGEPPSTAWR